MLNWAPDGTSSRVLRFPAASALEHAPVKSPPRWAPYLVLGPVTGPLTHRLYRSLEARRPILATLYLVAILESYVVLPVVLLELLQAVLRQRSGL